MLRNRSLLFVNWLLLIVPFAAHAQTSGSVIQAASCQRTDVNAVINGPTHIAVNGDKIIIPSTGSPCTWTSGITISGVGIDITGTGTPNTGGGTFGAGTPNTTLIDNAAGALFTFTGLTFGETAKVELLSMSAAGAGNNTINVSLAFSGTCTASGCANIRVDNINYVQNTWGNPLSGGFVVVNNVFGVVDHNTVNESSFGGAGPALVEVNYSSWQGVGDYGDNSFAAADTFGTGQAIYIENNSSNFMRLTDNDITTGGNPGGARYVCRFNTITNMPGTGICSAHGTAWGGRFRGQRQVEVYYNTVSGTICNNLTGLLSGTGYFFSNSYTGSGCNVVVGVDIARLALTGTPWNHCDGTQPWDQSPWSSTTACLDQPGSGAGAGLENATPLLVSALGTPCTTAGKCWPHPALDPIYEAGDVTPNGAPGIGVSGNGSSTRVLANRDYYAEVSTSAQSSSTSPFNGTTGTGYGTLANRPTTCTTGVAYWATDQGNWNQSGSGGQGQLFKCSATNTWAMTYEPYTYPHPLIAGGTSGTGGNVNPPTSLTATVQ